MADFGWALSVLANRGRVARVGWNGKGMWLTYVSSWKGTFKSDMPGRMTDASESRPGLPFIAMKTVTDLMVPWLASQTDVLALDWELVNDDN